MRVRACLRTCVHVCVRVCVRVILHHPDHELGPDVLAMYVINMTCMHMGSSVRPGCYL